MINKKEKPYFLTLNLSRNNNRYNQRPYYLILAVIRE